MPRNSWTPSTNINASADATAPLVGASSTIPNILTVIWRVSWWIPWAEHQRQHDRFTLADREFEEQVTNFSVQPSQIRHFIYATKPPSS